MTLNPKLNLSEAEAWPYHARHRGVVGTRTFCRVIPVLLALLTLICSPQARAQASPLTINSPAVIAEQYPSPPPATGVLSWAPVDLPVTGQVAYEGECCPGSPADPFLTDPRGKIALIDETEYTIGSCTVSSAIDRAGKAGAIGVLVVTPYYEYSDVYYDYQEGSGSYVPTLLIDAATANLIKGSAEAVTVTLTPPPGIRGVRTLPGTELSLTSETLNGLVYPNGVETTVYFEYGADESYGNTTPEINVGTLAATIPVSAIVSDLSPNTVYHTRLVAVGGDFVTFGRDQVFKTASLPMIDEQPADQLAMVGEPVVISAGVSGSAPLSYQWSHDGTVIRPFGTGTSQLSLPPVNLTDAGNYRLDVINPYTGGISVSSTEAHLTVIPAVPPTVVTLPAGNVKKIEATLEGTVNPNGGHTTVHFEYGTTTDYGKATAPQAVGNGTSPIPVNNVLPPFALAANTTYHFRLVATSVGGTAAGDDVQFTTLPAVNFVVVNTLNSGSGSLRGAIAAAELADTIHFDPALNGQTITLSSSLVITGGARIFGPGASQLAVSGNNVTRVFVIAPGGNAFISGLTIRNSTTGSNRFIAGGNLNQGTLTLEDCVLSANTSRGGAGAGGGGLLNQGNLTVRRCIFNKNRAVGSGGAIWNSAHGRTVSISDSSFVENATTRGGSPSEGGGAIYTDSTVTVSRCLFQGNTADPYDWGSPGGGALLHDNRGYFSSEVSVTDSTFISNACPLSSGGAIINSGSRGRMTIRGSTFSGNRARGGGAIVSGWSSIISIVNSTLSSNTANYGGAVYGEGVLELRCCTITGNISKFAEGGGIRAYAAQKLKLGNCLIVGNTGGTHPDVAMLDIDGNSQPLTSLGHNIIGVGDQSLGWTAADLVGSAADPVDPLLGPLADNGGPTWTHALLPGSPAMNSGDNALADSPDDQRGAGFPRLYGKAVDVGAYEVSDPFTVHSDVLFDLIQLRNGATESAVAETLTAAITQLSAAVAPSLWLDTYRLAPAAGHAVFTLDLAVVGILKGAGLGAIDPELLLCMADRIARADREIAVTGIDDGALRGSPMETALAMLANGDDALARGNPAAAAIAHYQSAWKQSLKAKK